jgi:WD40 repeat protein
MAWSNDGNAPQNEIMASHCDGEVWGLEVISLPGGHIRIVTSADDNRLICYDGVTHKKLAEGHVGSKAGAPKKKKKKRGGASSMSSLPDVCQSRCVAYCYSKNHLAVAANDGKVTIREIDWDHVEKDEPHCLDSVLKTLFGKLKNAEWIETMEYSPNEEYLAVGSHDNNIYLVETKAYKQVKKLTGHSSFLKAIDWTADNKYIRSVCGAHELLFFNAKTKKRDAAGASNTVPMLWADQTCQFGWTVQGIIPSGCDGTHINTVCLNPDQSLIATGDDYGLVSLFRNPALNKHKAKRYRGHSEHVTHVRFSASGALMFSTGGQDQTMIQWRVAK